MLSPNKIFLTLFIATSSLIAQAQVVSVQSGPWHENATWGGTPPTAASGPITILHNVTVSNGTTVTADELIIGAGGTLTINSGSTFILEDGAGNDLTITSGSLNVSGVFVCTNGAELVGTTAANTNFQSGSEYRYGHLSINNAVPLATWHPASTLNINSVTTGATVAAGATYWAQDFGNVTINCPDLTSAINFNGHLRNIRGNLNILNTGGNTFNSKQIVLATAAQNVINIDGSFVISGTSVAWFSVAGATVTYNVGQDLQIATTTTTAISGSPISLLVTQFGEVVFNINRDLLVNIPPAANFNLTTGANSFNSTFRIGRNFTFTSGTMVETPNSNRAVFEFMGTSNPQTFTRGGSASLPGGGSNSQIDWIVHPASTLNLGTSIISSGSGSTVTINGTLGVGSTEPTGALQNSSTAGNIQVPVTAPSARTYGSSSVIVYNGTAPQFMANVHNVPGMDVVINNTAGVSLSASVVIAGDLTLSSGNLNSGSNALTVNGNLSLPSGSATTGNIVMGTATLTLNGNSSNQPNNYISVMPTTSITIGGTGAFGTFPFQPASTPTIGNFTLNRTAGGSVVFAHDVTINGNTTLANGNLIFSDRQLTIAGAFSATNGRLFSNSNSILEVAGFSNTGILMFDGGGNTLNELLIDKQTVGTTVTLGTPVTVGSAVSLLSGILDNNAGITLGDGAVVTRDSDSEIFTNGFTNSPGETYDVVYIGSDPYTTGLELPTNAEDLNNLTIGGGPVTLDHNITINGDMLLSTGELNTVSSNITMEGARWEANGALFVPGSGTVTFTGTTLVFGDATPQFGNVQINASGNVSFQSTETNISGNFIIATGGQITSTETLVLNGTGNQNLGLSGNTVYNVTVNKTPNTNVMMVSPMNLTGLLLVLSNNTDFYSDGNLTIISADDNDFGVQAIGIGPLPNGSSVFGDVSVQRYMSGEGRIWRYISSPITNGTVGDLMNYFPVTGTFEDPSEGEGIRSDNPSFYFYNEAILHADIQRGWTPYPTSGTASAATLTPGRGYSAFIREADLATTWVLTGTVNQGNVQLPVTFGNSGNPTADGWNLVGNPYPCTIFWGREEEDGTDPEGWTRVNIGNGVAIRENTLGEEHVLIWDGETGDFTGDIAIGQAFWVQATGATPQLTVHETAKSFTNGAFYRKSAVDYIQIELSKNNSYKDRVYIRQRKNATPGLDSYDIPKMDNSYYSLSIKATDNTRLALSATSSIVCGENIPLELTFAKNANGTFVKSPAGQYKLYANQFGLYGSHTVTLKDKFTGATHTFQEDQPYAFTITTNAQSYRADRFELSINATPLLADLRLGGADVVCADPNAVIVVESAQADVEYQAFRNGVAISAPQAGEGRNLNLLIPNDSLTVGTNVITVKALNGCSVTDLTASFTLKKENIYSVTATESSQVCRSGAVTLTASGASANGIYKWYDKQGDTTPLFESASPEFVTEDLTTSEVFYVAITNTLGCEGPRIAVKANVINYEDAVITSERVNELRSNYAENNSWYLNGEALNIHDQVIRVSESGVYRLDVTVAGCLTSVEQEYIVTGPAAERVEVAFGVYPNPVEDVLVIQGVSDINSVKMISATGAEMKLQWLEASIDELKLFVGDLQSGIYYLSAREGNRRKTLKVVRK